MNKIANTCSIRSVIVITKYTQFFTFANGNLITNDGTTIVLSGLARMYFSETSGIATQQVTLPEGRVDVFTIAGNHVATFENAADVRHQLTKGIYVIRPAKGSTTKIVIR